MRDFMTRRLFALPADAPAVAAIDIMLERGVGAVPIVGADGKPVGIVGEVDFLEDRSPDARRLSEARRDERRPFRPFAPKPTVGRVCPLGTPPPRAAQRCSASG